MLRPYARKIPLLSYNQETISPHAQDSNTNSIILIGGQLGQTSVLKPPLPPRAELRRWAGAPCSTFQDGTIIPRGNGCRYRFSWKPISTYMSLTLARLCGECRLVRTHNFQDWKIMLLESRWRNQKAVEEGFLEIGSHWRRFSRISWKSESRWRKSNFERENRILREDFPKGYSGRNIIVWKRLRPDNVSSSKNVFEQTELHL